MHHGLIPEREGGGKGGVGKGEKLKRIRERKRLQSLVLPNNRASMTIQWDNNHERACKVQNGL